MKRSQSGSKSCHSGGDVIGRTWPLDTAFPYIAWDGKAEIQGEVLLGDYQLHLHQEDSVMVGEVLILILVIAGCFSSMREYNAIEKLWWYYGIINSISLLDLTVVVPSHNKGSLHSTIAKGVKIGTDHFLHKIHASLHIRNLMFAQLIFACCADIKYRVANIIDKRGGCS